MVGGRGKTEPRSAEIGLTSTAGSTTAVAMKNRCPEHYLPDTSYQCIFAEGHLGPHEHVYLRSDVFFPHKPPEKVLLTWRDGRKRISFPAGGLHGSKDRERQDP